jgi:hypothetical protein
MLNCSCGVLSKTVPCSDGCDEFSTNTCWIVPVGSYLKLPCSDGCNEFSTNTCWIVPVGSCLKLCSVVMAVMNFRPIHFHVGSYLKLPCSDDCDEFSTNKKNINIVNDHTGNFLFKLLHGFREELKKQTMDAKW